MVLGRVFAEAVMVEGSGGSGSGSNGASIYSRWW